MTKPIYILALHNVRTGGPEACHQLSDALIEQGFDARMVYYTWEEIAQLEQASPQSGYRFGERTNGIEEYLRYKTNVTSQVPNSPDVVVVLTETLCHLAPKFDKATVLVWWLSLDNGFGALARVNLNHLRAPNVQHAAQSIYANRFIVTMQFTPAAGAILSDYSADLKEYAEPLPWAERPRLALFNANQKVTADLQAIADDIGKRDPSIACMPIKGLSRAEAAGLMAKARAYIDLGSFPGKDRLPREARRMGCIPIVACYGAGRTDFEGMEYIHCYEGDAARLVVAAMDEPAPDAIFDNERAQFRREVKAVFSGL